MRRQGSSIWVFFAVLLTCVYLLLNTTWPLVFLAPRLVKKYLKNVELKSFQVQKQTFQFPNALVLEGVRFTLKRDGKTFFFDVPKATIHQVVDFWKEGRQLKGFIRGGNMICEFGEVKNFDLNAVLALGNKMFLRFDGVFRASSMDLLKYHAEEFFARVKGDTQQLQISEIFAKAYGGQCQGQISLGYHPVLNYLVWLEMTGLEPRELEKVHKRFFAQFEGLMDGTARLGGTLNSIDVIAVDIVMPRGGALKAGLMRRLSALMADLEAKAAVDWLAANEGKFPVDKATVHIQNGFNNKIVLLFNLENAEQHLYVKESLDINLKGGLAALIFLPKSPQTP
jgi:hypothetical protein